MGVRGIEMDGVRHNDYKSQLSFFPLFLYLSKFREKKNVLGGGGVRRYLEVRGESSLSPLVLYPIKMRKKRKIWVD